MRIEFVVEKPRRWTFRDGGGVHVIRRAPLTGTVSKFRF
jgi:hypothetical protein